MATKKKYTRRNIILFSSIGLILCVTPIYPIKKVFKKGTSLQTKSLYLQTKYPRIELPGDLSLSEKIDYKHAETLLPEEEKKQDSIQGKIDSGLTIPEVKVFAKIKFAPEHNGKVDVDFLVKVPKELLSPKWRITLSPKLLHNDSIVNLEPLILKGTEFYEMQKNNYAGYDSYIKSIIHKEKYDSAFLDRKAINKDIETVQGLFYDKYNSDWKKQKNYLDNLSSWQKMQNFFYAAQKEEIANIYAQYLHKATIEKYNKLRQGKDSIGVYKKYMKEFEKEKVRVNSHWEERRKLSQKMKPKNGENGISLNQIKGRPFSMKDSVELAKTRYDFAAIAQNELKKEQKDVAFDKFVKYPYKKDDSLRIRLDSVINNDKDFTYLYKQSYDLSPNLKMIRVYMESVFEATDFSSYTSSRIDTLTYNITTLAQLADTSYIYDTYHIKRDMELGSSAFVKYSSKGKLFDINYKNNKKQIKEIEEAYKYFLDRKVFVIDTVTITLLARSWAFGDWEGNYLLSQKQSNAIKEYLANTYKDSISAEVKYISQSGGENWKLLASAIKESNKIENKEIILNLLATATYPDKTKDEIKKKYKKDYAFICDSIYPSIEKTIVTITAHRNDVSDDKSIEKRQDYKGEEYAEGVRLLMDREYEKALPKLESAIKNRTDNKDFNVIGRDGDYNLALCLTCLGHNAQAYMELIKIKPNRRTGNDEYLLALICSRLLNKEEEAVEHLKRSFELDESKKLRVKLDYEVFELAKKNNIDLK
ncbi:MAG: hypothetical protein H6Q14_2970 [Bacteroidetes bacterium]|nr:hypothetical protein [Bacteroidota bacterium]